MDCPISVRRMVRIGLPSTNSRVNAGRYLERHFILFYFTLFYFILIFFKLLLQHILFVAIYFANLQTIITFRILELINGSERKKME